MFKKVKMARERFSFDDPCVLHDQLPPECTDDRSDVTSSRSALSKAETLSGGVSIHGTAYVTTLPVDLMYSLGFYPAVC